MQKDIKLEEVSIRPEGKDRVILFQFTGMKFFSIRLTKGMSLENAINKLDDIVEEVVDWSGALAEQEYMEKGEKKANDSKKEQESEVDTKSTEV